MRKILLIVLDGWGMGEPTAKNAIFKSNTPFFDALMAKYPHTLLLTHGAAIGLPAGQMGNSEVGHLSLGAGRKIPQELSRINQTIAIGELKSICPSWIEALKNAKKNGKKIHFIGLLSRAGVHSHSDHLLALLELSHQMNLTQLYVHVFTDGRDTAPENALEEIDYFKKKTSHIPVKIASLIGRYYAMDRDKRWERIAQAYHLLTDGVGQEYENTNAAIWANYAKKISDEFFTPCKIKGDYAKIDTGDVVICFNFRSDRCRELVQVFTQFEMPEQRMKPLDLTFFTLTQYDKTFKNISTIFLPHPLEATLGEKIAQKGLTQLRAAETEKYPHVTYFFSGGKEEPFAGEARILVPSPKVSTYDLAPEMSAHILTQKTMEYIADKKPDFVLLNYANADMVGHTANFAAIVQAVETVDACLAQIVPFAKTQQYISLILADHGNAELTQEPDGTPHTSHTTNLVPCILVADALAHSFKQEMLQMKSLCDVAPFIERLMLL